MTKEQIIKGIRDKHPMGILPAHEEKMIREALQKQEDEILKITDEEIRRELNNLYTKSKIDRFVRNIKQKIKQ